ncbi:MAG: T9SS type A sorting domain-containing protein, partial [Bacteroidales bacterium]|nr:T9SS type A sorting domain-containing protein [Bacteroidales bacterium]
TGTDAWTGVTVEWYPHTGVAFYDMEADTTPAFNSAAKRSVSNAYYSSSNGNSDTRYYMQDLYFGKTYYWRVRARNANDTTDWSTPWTFNTNDYVTLTSPTNALLNVSVSGTNLDWNAHTGVAYYQLQIDTTNLFNSLYLTTLDKPYISSSSGNSDTQQNTGPLLSNKVYFWRVRAFNAIDSSEWTSRTFSTGSNPILIPTVPVLTAPYNGISGIGSTTTLVWNSSTNATAYDYIYSTSPNFTGATVQTVTQTQIVINSLINDTTYYWKVRAKNGPSIYSDWSATWTFNTGTACTTYELYETVSVCLGDTYTFPDGSVQNNITVPVNHTSNLLTIYQCDSIIHTTVNVIIIDISVSINNNTLTANASGLIYKWVDCNNMFAPVPGAVNQSFTPLTNGMFAVEITSGNCTQMSGCYVITTVDAENVTINRAFNVYPNPSQGVVHIDIPQSTSVSKLRILNITGQEILNQNIEATSEVSLRLPSGMYVIEFMQDGYLYREKLMVQH